MGTRDKDGPGRDEADTFFEEGKDTNKEGFAQQLRHNEEFRHKIIHTTIVCWSFITLGWSAGMGGPTFPDLRQIVQKDLGTASWLFTSGAIGYVLGSLVFGVLYDKFNKLLLLAFTSFWFAVFTCVKPWCSLFPVMIVVNFLAGTFCGGLDTGGNADIPYIWGTESGPYMQALHMCFCLGAILSPLATEPFLSKKVCQESNNTTENSTLIPLSASMPFQNSGLDDSGSTCEELYGETRVHYAFLTCAILIFTATIGYLFLYCKMSHVHASLAKQQKDSKEARKNISDEKSMPLKVKAFILILLASLMMSYCVMEDGFASFLMTFTLNRLNWNKDTGSYITTVFWACFVTGRFFGIFIVGCCKQSTMLTTYLCFIALSSIGFLLASIFSVIPLIWIFTGTLGFSMSIVFPCIFGWTSENILKITGKISSMFLVSAGLGAMLFPLLVGYLMEYVSPLWFAYMLVVFMGITVSIYTTIRVLAHFFVHRKDTNTEHIEYGKEPIVLKSETLTINKNDKLYHDITTLCSYHCQRWCNGNV